MNHSLWQVAATILLALTAAAQPAHALFVDSKGNITAACDSPIYCYGELLHSVSLAQPFKDSKTFVDMYVHTACMFPLPLSLSLIHGSALPLT